MQQHIQQILNNYNMPLEMGHFYAPRGGTLHMDPIVHTLQLAKRIILVILASSLLASKLLHSLHDDQVHHHIKGDEVNYRTIGVDSQNHLQKWK